MSHFYLTLPSNASMNLYPDNTVAKYTTHLPNHIELDGDWEVGLTEIIYAHKFPNIRGEYFRLYHRGSSAIISIKDGYYSTAQSLINEAQETVEKESKKMRMQIDFEKALTFRRQGPCYTGPYLYASDRFMKLYDRDQTSVPDVIRVDSLFVYCDILEHVPVGDTLAPLLRSVVVDGKQGDRISEQFINPMYLPIQKKSFESIEINIMTDTGESVPFIDGPSTVTLHFRRARNPYLLSK